MNTVRTRERNNTIDFFRGVAMLMVVLGHTMSNSIDDYRNTFVYNLIWTLQMPMFMIISGYVTAFSKEIKDIKAFGRFVRKRTMAYLFPWLVWTVVIRGILLGNQLFLNPGYLLWHMDSGYWFLTSLWTICVIYGIGQFLSSIVYKKENVLIKWAFSILFSLCGIGCIALIGVFFGIGFLGIKFSLYYFPFFLSGVVFSRINKRYTDHHWYEKTKDIVALLSGLLFVFLLMRCNFAVSGERIFDIGLRMAASVFGCMAVFGFGSKLISKGKPDHPVIREGVWIGIHSLEIYLIHYLVLSPIKTLPFPSLYTLTGAVYMLVNGTMTVLLSVLLSSLIHCNGAARKLLFGK